MSISNSIDWQIESIRVTGFINGQLNPNKLETWLQKVSENLPLEVNKKPTSFVGVSRSSAGFLRVNWNSNRLDVILSSEEPQSHQTIASLSEADSLFHQFVDSVPEIEELAVINRLALGLIMSSQIPSFSEGYEVLSTSIVGLDLPRSARDFLYRVNHPYVSQQVKDLNINRLATWSVSKAQIIEYQLNPDGSQTSKIKSESPLAIRLELDINTDQTFQLEADLEKIRCLLDELKMIALDVAKNGEFAMRE